jgi:hypothetical protein
LIAGVARHAGNACLAHQSFGLDLVAHRPDRGGRRADEREVRILTGFGEFGVLGQKAVARVHRVGARPLRGGEDRLDIEIALAGRSRSDADRLVRRVDMRRIRVGVAVDRDSAKPKIPRRARDPAGDLGAVRDQDFVEGHIGQERL